MTKEFEGKIALVTGGSRGIGLATARDLADGGARVALLSRDQGRADRAAGSLPDRLGRGYVCDVSSAEQVSEVVAHIEEELGPVDILVNNAGMTRDQLIVRLRDQDWDDVLGVNLDGMFYMIRAVARSMLRRREGVIVNITSIVGLTGNAGQANYAAAKAGVVGLTKAVARELAPRGIRVNAVAPGFIDTEMTADLSPEAREHLQAKIALGHLGAPEDVASVVRFLAGPGAGYITGQVVVVDGGMVM